MKRAVVFSVFFAIIVFLAMTDTNRQMAIIQHNMETGR